MAIGRGADREVSLGCVMQPFFVSPLLPEGSRCFGRRGVSAKHRRGGLLIEKAFEIYRMETRRISPSTSRFPMAIRRGADREVSLGCVMQPFFVFLFYPYALRIHFNFRSSRKVLNWFYK